MRILKLCEDLFKVPTVHNQRSQLQIIKEGFIHCYVSTDDHLFKYSQLTW